MLLRENKLFAGMSDATIAECATQFTLIQPRRRQHLYCQGDSCNQIYCLLRGSVRIARLREDGSEFTTRIIGRADLFGEEGLFGDASFTTTATALSDGVAAVCPAARIRALITRYPTLSINIAHYLRDDQIRTLDRLEQFLRKPVRDRLLTLFQELALQCEAPEEQDGKCEIALTHVEIASLIGSARETVSSELSKLASAGLICKRGRKILIDLAATEAA